MSFGEKLIYFQYLNRISFFNSSLGKSDFFFFFSDCRKYKFSYYWGNSADIQMKYLHNNTINL